VRDARLVKWAKEVERTPLLQNTTKVLLLGLYIDGIDAEWKISIPRTVMAERMGVSTRQVERRIADAVRVGFLRQEIHGWEGTTAVYMASAPKSDAVPRPRRARSDRAPWLQDDPRARRFQGSSESESSTRGGGALPVDNTACRPRARHAGGEPVVTRATNEPAHPNGVPDLTPTDTGTSAYLLAEGSTDPLASLDGAAPVNESLRITLTANGTATATADVLTAAQALSARGQSWLQEEGLLETQARLSTADLGPSFLGARIDGAQ
jgi:hypothetical protein